MSSSTKPFGFSKRSPQATTPAESQEHRTERELCLDDPAHFILTHCKLRSDTGAGLIPFDLFDYQRDLLRDFLTHRELIILKARQLGISELVAAYAVWLTLKPQQNVILLSQTEKDAGELLLKCRTCYDSLPAWLPSPVLDERKSSTLELANGSRILPVTATPRSGRGFNAQLLVFDEWAHQQAQAEIYAAAAPTAKSAGNQIIGLSSANGVGNFFARQWELAQNGKGAHPKFLPWNIRPGRDQAWYDETTYNLEDWQRAQEYPTTADEAFILSGRPRFDPAALRDIALQCADPVSADVIGVDQDGRAIGYQRIWQPPQPGRRYVAGADTAEGLPKGDYSTAVIQDVATGTEVAELHGHWQPDEFAHHLAVLCRRYGNAFLGVERNNHGHAVLLALQKIEHYPNLYRHAEYDARTPQTPGAVHPAGWQTSSKSKPLMIDALAETIRERRPYRNALFIAEARVYTILDNGDTAASGDMHDDRVVAYAIAEQMRRQPVRPFTWAAGPALPQIEIR
ncbi:MAG: terminase large subunit domain-containing protein [Candidatus Dormibacteria bacterium]